MSTRAKIWASAALQDLRYSQRVRLDFGPIPKRMWFGWWEQKTQRLRLAYKVLRTGDCGCSCY